MSRAASLCFALVAYAIFFATFLYLIAFVGDIAVRRRTVDRGPDAPLATAVVIDVALIALFGLQHSVMARQGFKRAWTRIVPAASSSAASMCSLASAALIILFLFWRPIDGDRLGRDQPGCSKCLLWALFAAGWLIVLLSTFLINHFELFGLQQAWFHMRGRQAAAPQLRQPFFYKWVAPPALRGFFLAFWATPQMTLRPSAARGRHVGLHADRHPLRGARPQRPVRQGLRRLSRERRDADSAVRTAQRLDAFALLP